MRIAQEESVEQLHHLQQRTAEGTRLVVEEVTLLEQARRRTHLNIISSHHGRKGREGRLGYFAHRVGRELASLVGILLGLLCST